MATIFWVPSPNCSLSLVATLIYSVGTDQTNCNKRVARKHLNNVKMPRKFHSPNRPDDLWIRPNFVLGGSRALPGDRHIRNSTNRFLELAAVVLKPAQEDLKPAQEDLQKTETGKVISISEHRKNSPPAKAS